MRRPDLPEPLEQRQAILIGKPPIQQNQVPFTRPKRVPGRCPVAGMLDHISFLTQPAHQKVRDVRLILDHQHPDAHGSASPHIGPPDRFTRPPP